MAGEVPDQQTEDEAATQAAPSREALIAIARVTLPKPDVILPLVAEAFGAESAIYDELQYGLTAGDHEVAANADMAYYGEWLVKHQLRFIDILRSEVQ
jgi:hypothetical protein